MKIRTYTLGNRGIRIALLTDLHNRPWEGILEQVARETPDLIAIAGDLTFHFTQFHRVEGFLRSCKMLAPTYVSLGNHDCLSERPFCQALENSGVTLLDNGFIDTRIKGMAMRIGGMSAPTSRIPAVKRFPKVDWLPEFADSSHFKILLSHQPEAYPRYLSRLPIDLVLSGHAHGGQWRIGNQGIFAPGQGLFPKLTGGAIPFENGTLVISRGLSNTTWIPRFFNPREIVMIEL